MRKRILRKIEKKKITAKEGFDLLYKEKRKPVRFADLRLRIKDQPGLSCLLKVLFFFPIPVRLVIKIAMRYVKEEDIPQEIIDAFLQNGGGTTLFVDTDEVKIDLELL
ncbi:MAG TPA: hypothetical protein PLH44_00260 [Bacilli bacterium]|jgi:hypothetical protein|nr:hypothetical protein [Bacilli bacterium]HPL54942.1 hypothetical protein [Bacilli bacterium]